MKFKRITITVSVLFALLVFSIACAPQEAKPTEGPSTPNAKIVIGILEDLSGALAARGIGINKGYVDAIRYINEEQGGIQGHEIEAITIDHKMDSTEAITGWNRLIREKAVVVMGSTGAAAPVLWQPAEDNHIPILTGGGTIDQVYPAKSSFFFSTIPHVTGMMSIACKLYEDDWAKRGKSGNPKIGFDVVSVGIYPKIYGKSARLECEKRGWELTITNTGLAAADVTTQMLQMREANVDYIHLQSTDPALIAWFKEFDRQNFHPLIVTGSTSVASNDFWGALGELAAGAYAMQYNVHWTETEFPLIKMLHEINAKWHPDVTYQGADYIRGFIALFMTAEGLNRAVEKVGIENLNGDALKEAMETINDFDTGMGAKWTWTATDHQGMHDGRWYRWRDNGTLEAATDWILWEQLPQEQRTNAWWLKD